VSAATEQARTQASTERARADQESGARALLAQELRAVETRIHERGDAMEKQLAEAIGKNTCIQNTKEEYFFPNYGAKKN
jgi:hypothetical protein